MNIDQVFNERVRFFQEFLDQDYGHNEYKDRIAKMVSAGKTRLMVNINDLRQHDKQYCEGILKTPIDYVGCFEKALRDVVLAAHSTADQEANYHIGFFGAFGEHQVSPRELCSEYLGKMIMVEGIVTRCIPSSKQGSLVRPKVAKSVHYCEKTGLFLAKEYNDGFSLGNQLPTGTVYPKEDDKGNPLTTEFGLSVYRDYQMSCIQEMPERSPAGELPRPIDIILDDDLVDQVKPGDRVRVVGTYRSLAKSSNAMSATFRISLINTETNAPTMNEQDVREIKKISKRKDVFALVSSSLAPSLFGHEYIKKALLLLMIGGVEKNLENGTHLRGDINILLIGDPSVGKSQMLRFVLNLAPLAIATTGRGSSGVGLTAAVTQDKETGERTLEAGAMVLADRGVVCIDEFDKMSDIDRVAIHEVMEQQTVTIAKAGIHTSLNARCSVLAAANPAFGSYLDEKKPFENITLPDSLLSRFDLVFVVLDKTDDEFNRAISEHITRLHRYIPPGVEEGAPMTEAIVQSLNARKEKDEAEQENTPVFQKYNELLHIGLRPVRSKTRGEDAEVEILSIPFIKKYLFFAKSRIVPKLTDEACDFISTRYAELRSKADGADDKYKTMPITPRTLETLIRLSTAHARVRLSKKVEMVDAEVAFEILVFALFKEVKQKKREKRTKVSVHYDNESEPETEASTTMPSIISRPSTAKRSGVSSKFSGLLDDMSINDAETDVTSVAARPAASRDIVMSEVGKFDALSGDRLDEFRRLLFGIKEKMVETNAETLSTDDLMSAINDGRRSNLFLRGEVVQTITNMSDANMGVWFQEEIDSLIFV